jgi:hypothetical protein
VKPVPSNPVGWTRVVLALVVAAVSLTFAVPVSAQEETDEPAITVVEDDEGAEQEGELVVDEDTSKTVRRIRRDLVAVSVLTTLGLGVYVWYTNPARRLRIASRNADLEAGSPDEAVDH